MSSEVFFADMSVKEKKDGILEKIDRLCSAVGISELVGEGELTAVKLHFGELGNTAFIRPIYVGRIVDRLNDTGCKPFLVDANTLYRGSRSNAVDHLNTSFKHGFAPPTVNAPAIIADGLVGKDYVEVEVPGKYFSKVRIGSAAFHAKSIIAISHFKGHMVSGFGGAIKNIGMGLGSRSGKQQMHSALKPESNDNCIGCGACVPWCPVDAITLKDGRAVMDHEVCIGCGECTVTCPNRAIDINWEGDSRDMQERMCEYALGAMKGKMDRSAFFNFVIEITPNCDCLSWSDAPMAPDIGILASRDMVALDQASADLVLKAVGDVFSERHDVDWSAQLVYGEKIGLGTRKYKLTKV